MRAASEVVRTLLVVGGWAPLLVFVVHLFAALVVDAYRFWPRFDMPMHLAGGVAMAYFITGGVRALPPGVVHSSRPAVVEAVLVGALTTSVAVGWEFAEFAIDRVAGTNLQVSLANTMHDLALGILGAVLVVFARARR